jgi:hypothetical protein
MTGGEQGSYLPSVLEENEKDGILRKCTEAVRAYSRRFWRQTGEIPMYLGGKGADFGENGRFWPFSAYF